MKMKPDGGKSFGQAWNLKKKRRNVLKGKKKKTAVLRKRDIVDKEISEIQDKINQGIDVTKVEFFSDFPLSKNTLEGLKKAKYLKPTTIQKQALAAALQGKDILGAAKTGSGKTLAFLIPVLEVLYKAKASAAFGMVALIITPTRELAFQIFEVLQKICGCHDFTANLIIGGKFMSYEVKLMNTTNIVICTPGRLLHHFNQTHQFNADELKILVLDEADRIMDSKFAEDMNNIISYLPEERQTLLFSATQTKSVKDLARLGLKDPSYISADESALHSTPTLLQQSYIVCKLQDKLSVLLSFLKTHLNTKTMIFVQTCKQVRFLHAILRRELPGRPVFQLHGGMDQLKRIEIYQQFSQKQHVLMVTTDVACRGLDFPSVTWVVQLDCPIDAETYIHRVGRTARFEKKGQALLVLTPAEEERMVEELRGKKIPIRKIKVNQKLTRDITPRIASACAEDVELKAMAERAFRNYIFSISKFKQFDPTKIDLETFSHSLGLFKAPRLRFLEKRLKSKSGNKTSKKQPNRRDGTNSESSDDSDFAVKGRKVQKTKRPAGESTDSSSQEEDDDSEDDDSDNKEDKDSSDDSDSDSGGLFTVKNVPNKPSLTVTEAVEDKVEMEIEEKSAQTRKNKKAEKPGNTKIAVAKRLLKKGITANKKITFDDEGNVIIEAHKRRKEEEEDEKDDEGGINITSAAKRLRQEDHVDKQLERERIKQKHREERLKQKELKRAKSGQRRAADDDEEEVEAVLSGVDEDDDPFQYIPDPDKLRARKDDTSEEESGSEKSAEDDEEESKDESCGAEEDEQEEMEDDKPCPSNLEDAALRLLQNRRKR